jgi:hypothetical protein
MHKETIREQLDVANTAEDTEIYRSRQRVLVEKTEGTRLPKGTI